MGCAIPSLGEGGVNQALQLAARIIPSLPLRSFPPLPWVGNKKMFRTPMETTSTTAQKNLRFIVGYSKKSNRFELYNEKYI
jgi:hypothetical protein